MEESINNFVVRLGNSLYFNRWKSYLVKSGTMKPVESFGAIQAAILFKRKQSDNMWQHIVFQMKLMR